MRKSGSGFTIVELLIVVVVIAILASISVVAYTGIQNRAYDSAVQNDLKNFTTMIEMQKAESGYYPATLTPAMGFKFSKSAYGRDLQDMNVRYLYNSSTDTYILMANSRSGTFYSASNGKVAIAPTSLCYGVGPYGWCIGDILGMYQTNPTQNGFYHPYGWEAWTN